MSREAMTKALEALENSVDLVREDAYQAEKLYGNYPTRQGKIDGLKVLADDHEKAITALREALAEQPAYRAVKTFHEGKPVYVTEQPAQQEPVAIALNTGTKQGVKWLKNVEHGKSLYTSPQPAQQEPIIKSYLKKDNSQPVKWSDYEPDGMHYNKPAQRTWVGLTESEKSAALYDKEGMTLDYEDYAEAIEAKLKEKNNG